MLEEPREELQKSLSLHQQGQDTSSVEPPHQQAAVPESQRVPPAGPARRGEGTGWGKGVWATALVP